MFLGWVLESFNLWRRLGSLSASSPSSSQRAQGLVPVGALAKPAGPILHAAGLGGAWAARGAVPERGTPGRVLMAGGGGRSSTRLPAAAANRPGAPAASSAPAASRHPALPRGDVCRMLVALGAAGGLGETLGCSWSLASCWVSCPVGFWCCLGGAGREGPGREGGAAPWPDGGASSWCCQVLHLTALLCCWGTGTGLAAAASATIWGQQCPGIVPRPCSCTGTLQGHSIRGLLQGSWAPRCLNACTHPAAPPPTRPAATPRQHRAVILFIRPPLISAENNCWPSSSHQGIKSG